MQIPWAAMAMLCGASLYAQVGVTLEETQANWKTSREFTLAVAELMPAEEYFFRPNLEEMSFGALMIHLASAQAARVAQIAGVESPLKVPRQIGRSDAKRIAKELLEQSFEFCMQTIPKLSEEQLQKSYKVDWVERPEATGRQLLLGMLVHTAHHRAQAEVYLRVKNIKPPPYRF